MRATIVRVKGPEAGFLIGEFATVIPVAYREGRFCHLWEPISEENIRSLQDRFDVIFIQQRSSDE